MAWVGYRSLLSRYISNELSLEETEQLVDWLAEDPAREELLRDYQKTWDMTRNYPDSLQVNSSRAWQQLKMRILESDEVPHGNPAWKGVFILIFLFALLAVLILFYFLMYR